MKEETKTATQVEPLLSIAEDIFARTINSLENYNDRLDGLCVKLFGANIPTKVEEKYDEPTCALDHFNQCRSKIFDRLDELHDLVERLDSRI